MIQNVILAGLGTALLVVVHLGCIARAILRPHREPASRVAWVVVIVILPVLGITAYLLLGETSIGRRRRERVREVLDRLPQPTAATENSQPGVPDHYAPLFHVGRSVNGFEPVGGNLARLLPDSNATIEAIIADIDAGAKPSTLPFTSGCRTTTA